MELPNIETCNRRKAPLLDLTTEVIDNGDEKSDIDPENVKKISCDATPVNDEIIDGNKMNLIRVAEAAAIQQSDTLNCDKREVMDCGEKSTNESSKAFAFTIDFSEGKPVDSKKFNNIVERFQKRHRRGVSLDKIDSPTQPVANKAKPPLKKTEQKSLETEKGVKLRDKSQLSVGKESEMRHSWSPRTSLSASSKGDDTIAKFVPKSATLQLALKDVGAKEKFKIFDMTPTDEVIDDFVCPQPPLEFDKGNSDNESVSEAGTYTLDGDNYTEEQKAMMNIDKLPTLSTIICQEPTVIQSISHDSPIKSQPKHEDLEVIDLEAEAVYINRNSVVHTSSAHDGKRDKPKTSYLEKLKSKVRTIGDRAFHKNKSPDKVVPTDLDIGNFTSVTASGVFSKVSSMNPALPPRMARKNSLTKSHIDSSEYIQRSGHVSEKLLNSYTDYEKARHHEYQLNIFSQDCSTDIEKENGLGIKTAETKEDWIQEWAKNARRNNAQNVNASRNERAHSEVYTKQNYQSDEFGDNLERNYSPKSHKNRFNRYNDVDSNYKMYRPNSPKFSPKYSSRNDESPNYDDSEFIEPAAPMTRSFSERKENYNIQPFARPPISPTKIPSPMHSMTRPRSSSVSRSVHSSITDLDRSDTEMYLQKTAAAISTLQNIHRNSPQSPLSPSRPKLPTNFTSSPSLRRNQQRKAVPPTTNDILYGSSQSLHKRNLSLDGSEYKPKYQLRDRMVNSYNDEGLNTILNLKQNHTRHNSYEDKSNHRTIDQTFAPQISMRNHISSTSTTNKQQVVATKADTSSRTPTTQIKRSSSFSTKPLVRPSSGTKTLTPKLAPKTSNSSLQKSASSNSFKNMASKYEDNLNNEFYLNDEDDLDPNIYSSDSELSDMDNEKELITNTRYNKAFLIRLEQNKQKASGVQKQGSLACPNTPEMPRRGDVRARTSLRDRQSMPRDSSINRMKQDIPALSATKKALTTKEKEAAKKVIPKYLDISKYKPSQGNTFLKRDESKSTLVNKEIKRSASAFLNKSDVGRSSMRSVKSAASTTNKAAASVQNAKEVELAMWRKRASYDPMKAAAEGKKKQELARRSSQQIP